jgi:hypothetical protein
MHAGEAISAQFARGLHGSDPFERFGDGLLAGVVRSHPNFDQRMGELVDSPALTAAINAKGASFSDGSAPQVGSPITVIYNAAENRALSSEEDLFAALGLARATIGKGNL